MQSGRSRSSARTARLRRIALSGVFALALALGAGTAGSGPPAGGEAGAGDGLVENLERIEVLSLGVVAGAEGEFQIVLPGEQVTRVRRSSAVNIDAAAAQHAWLESGKIPGGARYHDMAERALLDLHMLLRAPEALPGAIVAAPTDIWRYVWPRDSSFIAVALAQTGHADDAERILRFLSSMQRPDGLFEARYLPDGSGVPDERPVQFDGCGWVPWAVYQWYEHASTSRRTAVAPEFLPMVLDCLTAIEKRVDPEAGLPAASPDYWEVTEEGATLGSAAALLLGMQHTEKYLAQVAPGRVSDIERARLVAHRLEFGIANYFAPAGFPRRLTDDSRDASLTFLQPPFTDEPALGVVEAWEEAMVAMGRPAGGLAPGESWRDDGVSWTPQTALAALVAAASGESDEAHRWLTWLDEHRTALGSIPEKVQADGSPGDVAPLGWSAATVLLALNALDINPTLN